MMKSYLFPSFFANASATFLFLPPTAIIIWLLRNKNIQQINKSQIFLTACCYEISYTAALEEGAFFDRRKQHFGKCLHLFETNSHYCRLDIHKISQKELGEVDEIKPS